jgi:death-on-curing protein
VKRAPKWIDPAVLKAVHGQLLAMHGGAPGVRDEGLLESALARPQQLFAYGKPDIFAIAAAYATGIARNHPFIDGNKRVAFMAAYVFLMRNGYALAANEADVAVTFEQLAAGVLAEDALTEWLRRNSKRSRSSRTKTG